MAHNNPFNLGSTTGGSDPTAVPNPAIPPVSLTPMPGKEDVSQATAKTYDAAQVDITPESTVSGQMEGLLSKSSPYMELARTGAKEEFNRRGLLNTSMAVGAGEKAAIESSLPIAQQDASTYGQSLLANQQATNVAAGQGAELGTQTELANVAAENRITEAQTQLSAEQQLSQQQAGLQEGLMGAEVANKERFAAFDADIRTRLAGVQQRYALQLENLSQGYEIEKNLDTAMGTMYDGALRSIATVLNDPGMTSAQSTSAVKVLIDNLGSGLNFMAGISGKPKGVQYA